MRTPLFVPARPPSPHWRRGPNPAIMFSFPKLPSAKDARNRRRYRQCRESRSRRLFCDRIANGRAYRAYRVSIRAWRGRRAIMIITGIRGAQLGQRSDRNALEHASRRDATPIFPLSLSLSSSPFFLLLLFFSSIIKINVVPLITRLPRGRRLRVPSCIFAWSHVNRKIVSCSPRNSRIIEFFLCRTI